MDEHFYNNDFEKFLQQQVKHHRMYPSDAVWKGIHKQMHGNKRWPGLYFIAILMVAALTVCTVYMDSTPIVYPQQAVVSKPPSSVNTLDPVQLTHETLKNINDNYQQQQYQQQQLASVISVNVNESPLEQQINIPLENSYYTIVLKKDVATDNNNTVVAVDETLTVTEEQATVNTQSVGQTQTSSNVVAANAEATQKTEQKPANTVTAETATSELAEEATQKIFAKSSSRPKKWQYEFYMTPSSDYRKIVDRKSSEYLSTGPTVSTYGVNANSVIRYKPGMGIEFGLGFLYSASNRIKLKAGVQYNVRQYNIEAYTGSSEAAKIPVKGGYINTVTKYRSLGGYGDALLLNKYHQVSFPVGVEYAVAKGKKVGFNVAGSVQPTYTFSQSSYLLTDDYKSYADGTSMIRKWNINSSLETVLTYKVGDFQWKFGPQVRYQFLPTYKSLYPIREYLIDYGFKIGFTKTIN